MATQCYVIKNHFFIKFLILLFFFKNSLFCMSTCNLNKKLYMIAIFMCYIPLRTPCDYASNPIYFIEFTCSSIFFFVLWFHHFFKFLIILHVTWYGCKKSSLMLCHCNTLKMIFYAIIYQINGYAMLFHQKSFFY